MSEAGPEGLDHGLEAGLVDDPHVGEAGVDVAQGGLGVLGRHLAVDLNAGSNGVPHLVACEGDRGRVPKGVSGLHAAPLDEEQ